jgi:hypothetical protein
MTPAAPPQYILTLAIVRQIVAELQAVMDRFHKVLSSFPPDTQQQQQQMQAQQLINKAPMLEGQAPHAQHPSPQQQAHQAQAQAQAQQQHAHAQAQARAQQQQQQAQAQAQAPAAAGLQPPQQAQLIAKRKPGVGTGTPSPAAAHTPPTIPASSPRTPKSPPKKATGASAVTTTTAAAAPRAKAVPQRRMSKTTQLQHPVKSEPGPSKLGGGLKRMREEEPATQAQAEEEPVTKRPKREDWDGPPSEELEKRQREMNSMESNQDVQNFLARATEEVLVSNVTVQGDDGSSGPTDDLSQTLHDLFKGMPVFDGQESFPVGPADMLKPSDLSPKQDTTFDELFLLDYFDFSNCEPDEPVASTSKLDPPDLVHGSSTNPSPESAAETPKGENAVIGGKGKDVALKTEDISNKPLALGVWSEINGGEAAYFEHQSFKFEAEIPAPEAQWAISSAGT